MTRKAKESRSDGEKSRPWHLRRSTATAGWPGGRANGPPASARSHSRSSNPSTTSTTSRARCPSGSQSFTDGGSTRRIGGKWLIGSGIPGVMHRFYWRQCRSTPGKSDRLLGCRHPAFHAVTAVNVTRGGNRQSRPLPIKRVSTSGFCWSSTLRSGAPPTPAKARIGVARRDATTHLCRRSERRTCATWRVCTTPPHSTAAWLPSNWQASPSGKANGTQA